MSQKLAHDIEKVLRTDDVKLTSDLDFTSMFLPEPILKGLKDGGFKKPSPIQANAVPMGRCGFDLIVQSKSGTGKTLVFSLLALESVKLSIKKVQALVLAPTREIATQIADVITTLGTFIGGMPVGDNFITLKDCQIAVGAPGRIKQLIELQLLDPKMVKLFVLDEADQLMNSNMLTDINFIYSTLSRDRQVVMCSATYPSEMHEFLSSYMSGALHVTPEGDVEGVLLGLKQFAYITARHPDPLARLFYKQQHLIHLLSTIQFDQCIVFSNYHSRAESLCNMLNQHGWAAEWLAGKQEQATRMKVMNLLKSHKVRVLVSTDLAARGIDVHGVNLVINMDIPWDSRTYLHRMGRAGRYGSNGLVITIVSDGQEVDTLRKTLGRIGGAAMWVSILPKNFKGDLWTSVPSAFEQMHGVVSNEDSEESACYSERDDAPKGADSEIDVSYEKVATNNKKKKKKKKGKKQRSSSLKRKKINLLTDSDSVKSIGSNEVAIYDFLKPSFDNLSYTKLAESFENFSSTWDHIEKKSGPIGENFIKSVEGNEPLEELVSDFKKMNTQEYGEGSDCEYNVNHECNISENASTTNTAKNSKQNVRKKQKRRFNSLRIRNSNDYTTSSSSSCSEGEYIVSEPSLSAGCQNNTQFTEYSVDRNTQFHNWYNMWYNQNMELQVYVDYCSSVNHT
ncbi:hypothetical protein AAG570_013541 [Ranatra chinensis]|uniref:RNA helicase n=1 Tax=Ranatra chinensis TaxID=642074 RepID=A0ABD0YD71_9HEMI